MNTNIIKTGIIYKLCSLNSNKCYIGSTTRKMSVRLSEHKHSYTRYLNGGYHYVTSFEICKAENIFIIELERVIGNKEAILSRERYYIENTDNIVNKNIAGRTTAMYYIDYKEKFQQKYNNNKDKHKQYYIENRDKILQKYNENKEKKQQYYIENKEKKQQYYIENKEKKQQYYIENKEKKQQYYVKNKEKIRQYYEKNKKKHDDIQVIQENN
jgi:hypothetical protein